MNTVTISVSSMDDSQQRFLAAYKVKPQGAHISFASVELLWKLLAPKRMALVYALTGGERCHLRSCT